MPAMVAKPSLEQVSTMVNWPPPGRYVVAVSGGADSIALLDLFVTIDRGYELVVGHVEHGLRSDSPADAQFVATTARRYHLSCHVSQAHLPVGSSEATARQARYRLLQQQVAASSAAGVITAHHQDDLLETSLLNLARGTGRRGLAPLQPEVQLGGLKIWRPLLAVSRAALREYAAARQLKWREDSTNADTTNPRNYVRHKLLPSASRRWRQAYLEAIAELQELNHQIDASLNELLAPFVVAPGYRWPRQLINDLSLTETAELLVAASRRLDPAVELNRRLVEELALFIHTGAPGRLRQVSPRHHLAISRQFIEFTQEKAPQNREDSV